jgi:hypothetical protein
MVAPKVRRVRVSTRLAVPLRDRLTQHCAVSGLSERAVIEDALRQYLDGTGDRTLFLKRFDRLDKEAARGRRDVELLSEAFGIYLRQWFAAHTPTVAEGGKPGVRASADAAFTRFAQHVGERFSGGHRFLDDLPMESFGEDRSS